MQFCSVSSSHSTSSNSMDVALDYMQRCYGTVLAMPELACALLDHSWAPNDTLLHSLTSMCKAACDCIKAATAVAHVVACSWQLCCSCRASTRRPCSSVLQQPGQVVYAATYGHCWQVDCVLVSCRCHGVLLLQVSSRVCTRSCAQGSASSGCQGHRHNRARWVCLPVDAPVVTGQLVGKVGGTWGGGEVREGRMHACSSGGK